MDSVVMPAMNADRRLYSSVSIVSEWGDCVVSRTLVFELLSVLGFSAHRYHPVRGVACADAELRVSVILSPH